MGKHTRVAKYNHAGLRSHATLNDKLFVGPARPYGKRRLRCGVCGADKPGAVCKACANRRNREYKARQADRVKASRSQYKKRVHASQAENRALRKAAKLASLPGRRKQAKSAWKLKNRGVVNESTAHRFAAKRRATPPWADRKEMQQVYTEAASMTEVTGIKWHVDHIVPLRSEKVCGLHVPANLRVLPWKDNVSKGNKTWPCMW